MYHQVLAHIPGSSRAHACSCLFHLCLAVCACTCGLDMGNGRQQANPEKPLKHSIHKKKTWIHRDHQVTDDARSPLPGCSASQTFGLWYTQAHMQSNCWYLLSLSLPCLIFRGQ